VLGRRDTRVRRPDHRGGPGPAAGLGDQNAIELACKAAPDEILHLEHLGVTFHRDGARAFGGASAARTFYVAGITGQALLHVLYEQLLKHEETVDRFEERFVTSLPRGDDGQCFGAIARVSRPLTNLLDRPVLRLLHCPSRPPPADR
jgi:succinate dehydrogenase/fumarate reductase flavoprotein subunit